MELKYNLFIALSLLITVASADLQVVNGKIKITTGTTSGCGDTVNFIGLLTEVYQEFKDYLDIEFVPWGRTVRNNDGSLTCQFGTNDCWANRLHRCILNKLQGNQEGQMNYMSCEFRTPFPSFLLGSYQCALGTGISVLDIDTCVNTSEGDYLDAAAQAAAALPMQIINFVPSIVFNNQIDVTLHTQARWNLRNMICSALVQSPETGVTSC